MVNKLKKYSITFKNLSLGEHNFYFVINDDFFTLFPETEINKGKVKIKVIMNVKTNSLFLNFLIKGKVKVQCDRCLDEFEMPIKYKSDLLFEFGDENSDITDVDDKMTISNNETEINLSQHFYEFIHLSLPAKRIHKKDENGKSQCNQEMIEKINKYKNSSKSEKEKEADPRWEKLKKLYN